MSAFRLARPACAALLLSAAVVAGGGAWFALSPKHAPPAEDPLPLPPEPPRLTDAPEYDRCLAMLPRDPRGAALLSEAWEASGGGEGARHCAALALLALGEPERAAERLEVLAGNSRSGPAARAAIYGQAAEAWMMAERPAQAHDAATRALSLAPEDPMPLMDRAAASAALGRHADAATDLERALHLDPDRIEAWVLRAAALRQLEQVGAAEADIGRALLLAPDNAEALLERGIIRQLRGDAAGARADWQRAAELAPDSATADLALQNLALNEAGPQRR